MKEGDLVIVVEPLPDWNWLDYSLGSIGIIIRDRSIGRSSIDAILEVYFFETQVKVPVPKQFLSTLGNLK